MEKTTGNGTSKELLQKKLAVLEKAKGTNQKEVQSLKQKLSEIRNEKRDLESNFNANQSLILDYKEQNKELKKILASSEEKQKIQAQEFSQTVSMLKAETVRNQQSFMGQKQALKDRINQLESDLEIIQRSVFAKDDEIHKANTLLREAQDKQNDSEAKNKELSFHLNDMKSNKAEEIKAMEVIFKAENEQLSDQISKKSAKLNHALKEIEDLKKHYETQLMTMENTNRQFQAEIQTLNSISSADLESKNQTIANLEKLLQAKSQELELAREDFTLKDEMKENLLEKSKISYADLQSDTECLKAELSTLRTTNSNSLLELQQRLLSKENELLEMNEILKRKEKESELQNTSLQDKIREIEGQAGMLKCDNQRFQKNQMNLESAISNLTKECQEYSKSMNSKENEVYSLKLEIENLVDEYDKNKSEWSDQINKLEKKLENREAALKLAIEEKAYGIAKLEESLSANEQKSKEQITLEQTKAHNLEIKLQELNSQCESVSQKYQDLQGTVRQLESISESERSSNRVQANKLQLQINAYMAEIQNSESELIEWKNRYTLETEKNAAMIKNYSSKLSEKESNLESLQARASSLVQEKEDLATKVCKLETQNTNLNAQIKLLKNDYDGETNQAKEQISNLTVRNQDLNDNVSKLQESKRALEMTVQDKERLISELENNLQASNSEANSLKRLTDRIENEMASVKKENTELDLLLKKAKMDSQQLQNEIASLREKMQDSVNLNNTFKITISTLESELNNNNSCQNQLQDSLLKIQDELKSAQNKLTFERNESYKKTQEVAELICAKKLLEENLQKERQRIETKDELLSEKADTINTLEVQLQNAKELHSSLETKLNNAIEKQKSTMLTFSKQLAEQQQLLEREKTETSRLNKLITAAESRIEDLSSKTVELESSNEALGKKLKDMTKTLNNTTSELSNKEEECMWLQESLKKSKRVVQQSNENIDKLSDSLETLNKQKKRLELMNDAKEKQIQDSDQMLKEQANLIEEYEKRLKEFETEISSQSKTVSILEEEIKSTKKTFELSKSELQQKLDFKNTLLDSNNLKISSLSELVEQRDKEFEQMKESHRQQLNSITSKYNSEKLEREKLENELDSTKAAKSRHEEESKSTIHALTNENCEISEKLSGITAEYDMKLIEFDQLKNEMESSTNRCRDLTKESSQLKETVSVLKNKVQYQDEDLSKLNSLLVTVKQQRENASNELEKVNKSYQSLLQELEEMKKEGKVEFSALRQQIKDLQKHAELSAYTNEKELSGLNETLKEKNAHIQIIENELEDAKSVINRSELRLTNEISSRQFVIKNVESKLREKSREVETLTINLQSLKQKFVELENSTESVIAAQVESGIKAASKEWNAEKERLAKTISEIEKNEQDTLKEMDRYSKAYSD
jgi:chromosome segregation ATPase